MLIIKSRISQHNSFLFSLSNFTMATTQQIKQIYALVHTCGANKEKEVQKASKNRTTHASELNEQEVVSLIETLKLLASKTQQQRRRIFSKIRSIKVLHSDDKLTEADALRYIAYLVEHKGLKVKKENRLNAYATCDLTVINTMLDEIAKKSHIANRKKMKAYASENIR